jgi:chromate transporter
VRFGSTPQAAWLLYGVKPVIMAIIVQALWGLGRRAVRGPLPGVVGAAVLSSYFLGVNEIALLFAGGLVVMVAANVRRLRNPVPGLFLTPALGGRNLLASSAAVAASFSLPVLFLTFLKIGAVLYGSGYVLLAFLRADFVVRFGWLTDPQLMDAVAVGQVTPGPLFTTATFIGYILGGTPGALLATLGIFLPSFFFVAVSNPLIPRMRRSAWVGGFLDGVNAASLGLMAAVSWQLGRTSVTDPLAIVVALISFLLLARYKLNSTWLIAGGAAVGWLSAALR